MRYWRKINSSLGFKGAVPKIPPEFSACSELLNSNGAAGEGVEGAEDERLLRTS